MRWPTTAARWSTASTRWIPHARRCRRRRVSETPPCATLGEHAQALSGNQERLAQLEEALRQAEAELEGHRAREGASAGSIEDELVQLRGELAKEHHSRKELEATVHDLHERSEAADVRLKRQREEFTRRME